MKILILPIFLYITTISASEELFELKSFNYSMENDAVVDTDFGYTHGARISLLYYRGDTNDSYLNIPFSSYKNTNNFISIAYANQMYNPSDINESSLIENDRPYAGYSYLEIGLHQATKSVLDSLSVELGVVGPSSGMESLQNSIHNVLGAHNANGWDNQLKDEYILQLNYMRRWRLVYDDIAKLNSVLVPYLGANLGNRSTKLSAGSLYRVGVNIPSDFGVNSMNEGGFSSVPTHSKSIVNNSSNWSLFLNLAAGANLVLRDIFLDGNTFEDSHSVDKNILNAYVMAGFTFRYKHFSLDFFHNYYTKEYDNRALNETYKGFSSIIFTYNFE
jgi:lipid A 3-O-deacylase